jgi:hypothetical protein
VLVISAVQGVLILSRATASTEPIERVSRGIAERLEA